MAQLALRVGSESCPVSLGAAWRTHVRPALHHRQASVGRVTVGLVETSHDSPTVQLAMSPWRHDKARNGEAGFLKPLSPLEECCHDQRP